MKKSILIAIMVFAITLNAHSQFSFGVAPGIATNSAYFGYKAGKVVPWVGLQLANGGFKSEFKDHYYDGSEWVDDMLSESVNVNLLMPSVGVKFFALEKGGLKAYFNLSGSKPMVSGKMKEDDEVIDDFAENLKKIKMFGAELGFGAEYFFSNNFSIGGEYAIRYLGGNHNIRDEYEYWGEPAVVTDKFSARFAPTIAKITLNFYFGAGE